VALRGSADGANARLNLRRLAVVHPLLPDLGGEQSG
jgi:hypothetical protein